MLYLDSERANAFVVAAGNVEGFRSEIESIFGHRVGGINDLFFDGADIAIQDGSNGGRRLRRLQRSRGTCSGAHCGRVESGAGNENASCDSKEQQCSCVLHKTASLNSLNSVKPYPQRGGQLRHLLHITSNLLHRTY